MWEIKITLDEGRMDIGSISATWTDEDGIFPFLVRSPIDEAGQVEFIARATVARDDWKAKLVAEKALSDAATMKANEEAP